MTTSSAGQLKSPQTFFVCRSVAPSHFRSSSSLIRLYFQCICIAMFTCICVWFLLYLFYVFAHSHLPTSYALPHSFSKYSLCHHELVLERMRSNLLFLYFLFLLPHSIIPLINMATIRRASLRPIRPYSERFFQMPKTGLDFLLNSWKLPPILKRQPFVWCLYENRINL